MTRRYVYLGFSESDFHVATRPSGDHHPKIESGGLGQVHSYGGCADDYQYICASVKPMWNPHTSNFHYLVAFDELESLGNSREYVKV